MKDDTTPATPATPAAPTPPAALPPAATAPTTPPAPAAPVDGIPAAAPEGDEGKVAAPNASWGHGVCRAHTFRARRAGISIYDKDQSLDEEGFKAKFVANPHVAGLDPTTILTLLMLAWKLYQMWKGKAAKPGSISESPDGTGEPEIQPADLQA